MAAAVAKLPVPYRRRDQGRAEPAPFYTRGGPVLLSETPSDPETTKPSKKQGADWSVLYNHCEQRRQALYT